MKTTIIVKLQFEALHCWPGVVEALPDIADIHFLQYPHRHLFYVTLEKEVSHSDRDVEIILFKRKVEEYLKLTYSGNLGAKSCEMLAEELLQKFDCLMVEVLEDNENGGRVYC